MGRARDPFYAKAPLVLLRFPVLLAGLVLGVALLSIVIAIFPLGMSAAATAFLHGEIREGIATRYGVGITYENENVRFSMKAPDASAPLHERMEELFEKETDAIPSLGEALTSIRGPQIRVEAGEDARDARLFYREQAASHVRIVRGDAASGVLVADSVADALGIEPGDSITLRSGGRRVRVRVGALYAALYREPPTGFWRPWRSSIYPPCPGDPGTSGCTPPPPFVLASESEVLDLSRRLGARGAGFGFDAPLRSVEDFTFEEARRLEVAYQQLARRMSQPGNELHEVFMCCGQRYIREIRYLSNTRLSSVVPQVLSQAEERADAAHGPLRLLQFIAIVVAGCAMLASALYSFAARRTEVSFLYAHGFSAREVAMRTALESLIPATLAATLGFVIATALVRTFGDSQLPRSSVVDAAALTGAGALIAIVVIAATAGTLFYRWRVLREVGTGSGSVRAVTEVGLVVVAIAVLAQAAEAESGTNDVEWSLVLAPLAVLAVTAIFAARMMQTLLNAIRSSRARLPHAVHLAIRRAAATRTGLLLFGLGTLFFGVFQNGLSIATALQDTVVSKSYLFVGSDVAASVDVGDVPPADLPWPGTAAWRIPHASHVHVDRGIDVIAVDPDTLADAAYWDARYGAPSAGHLMRQLKASEVSLPAVFVGELSEEEVPLTIGGLELTPQRVASVSAFPGMVSRRPAVVIAQSDLERVDEEQGGGLLGSAAVTAEWWIRGDPDEISKGLAKLDDPPYGLITAQEVRDIPYVSTTLATFKVLDLLGIVGGLLVVVAALAYLQTAERARAVSTQLAIRMQLTRRSLVAAAVLELALFITIAYVVALVPAAITAALLAGKLDPLRTIPPDVLFAFPAGWLAFGGLLATTGVGVGGALVARRALRADMSRLMRVAE